MTTNAAALVTGAGEGIGAATAIALSRQYRVVVVNYRNAQASAERVVERIERLGATAMAVRADLSVESEVKRLFQVIDDCGEPLRLLVNNAGDTGGFATVDTLEADQLDVAFRTCLRSTVLCTREAVKRVGGRGRRRGRATHRDHAGGVGAAGVLDL